MNIIIKLFVILLLAIPTIHIYKPSKVNQCYTNTTKVMWFSDSGIKHSNPDTTLIHFDSICDNRLIERKTHIRRSDSNLELQMVYQIFSNDLSATDENLVFDFIRYLYSPQTTSYGIDTIQYGIINDSLKVNVISSSARIKTHYSILRIKDGVTFEASKVEYKDSNQKIINLPMGDFHKPNILAFNDHNELVSESDNTFIEYYFDQENRIERKLHLPEHSGLNYTIEEERVYK